MKNSDTPSVLSKHFKGNNQGQRKSKRQNVIKSLQAKKNTVSNCWSSAAVISSEALKKRFV